MPEEQDNSTQPNPTGSAAGNAHGEPAHSLPPLTTAPTTAPGGTGAGSAADASEMDAANRSLSDALAVSFRVLRVLMLVILLIFLFSGFFTVQQDEVAVRTRFGRIVAGSDGAEVLTAEGGPYFRWPAPVGEVYRIPTTRQSLAINETFVFNAARGPNAAVSLQDVRGGGPLDPATDGSLLTGDGNLFHARFSVSYTISPQGAADYIRNIASGETLAATADNPRAILRDAERVVRFAVEQAIVADVASKDLDTILGTGARVTAAAQEQTLNTNEPVTPAETSPDAGQAEGETGASADGQETSPETPGATPTGEQGTAATDAADAEAAATDATAPEQRQDRVQAHAQAVLDNLNSGIEIIDVFMTDRGVPADVRQSFDDLIVANSDRARLVDEARTLSTQIYSRAAGRGYEALVAAIAAYERADGLRESQPEQFQQASAALDAMLAGQPYGPQLRQLAQQLPQSDPLHARLLNLARQYPEQTIAGRAAERIRTAQSEATQYVQSLEGEALNFEKLLAQYRQSPERVKQSLFADVLRDVLSSETATTEYLPPGPDKRIRLMLNEDPEIARQAQRQRRQQAGQAQQ